MNYMLCWGGFAWWILGYRELMERVKEASSSKVPQKVRDQCVHIVIFLEKPRSIPMQSYLRKCDMVLGPHVHGWVQSSSELLRELW